MTHDQGFPSGSEVKASAWNPGDPGLIPELGRSLEKEVAIHSRILAFLFPRFHLFHVFHPPTFKCTSVWHSLASLMCWAEALLLSYGCFLVVDQRRGIS